MHGTAPALLRVSAVDITLRMRAGTTNPSEMGPTLGQTKWQPKNTRKIALSTDWAPALAQFQTIFIAVRLPPSSRQQPLHPLKLEVWISGVNFHIIELVCEFGGPLVLLPKKDRIRLHYLVMLDL